MAPQSIVQFRILRGQLQFPQKFRKSADTSLGRFLIEAPRVISPPHTAGQLSQNGGMLLRFMTAIGQQQDG